MKAYCDKSSIDRESVHFVFEGTRLRDDQTPGEVDMQDQDEIHVMIHQASPSNLVLFSTANPLSHRLHGSGSRTHMHVLMRDGFVRLGYGLFTIQPCFLRSWVDAKS